MTINTRLQKLSPSLLDRLSKLELQIIDESIPFNIEVIRRMLRGEGDKFGYTEKSVIMVVAKAIEVMKATEEIEKLEASFKKYIEAA